MKLTPEEKARSAAVMRELLGGTKETEVEPLKEPNRGFLYLASFAVIAIGLTFAAAYYFGAWDASGSEDVLPADKPIRSGSSAGKKLSPLTPSTLPPETAQKQPTKPTLMTYRDPPRRSPAPAPSRQATAPAYTSPTQTMETDRTNEHRQKAIERVMRDGGIVRQVESVEQVAGWTGRYRTTGEATFYRYSGDTPKPKRFEVLTQEENDLITSVDFTIKW